MKGRIEHLLYNDEARLPLLALLPDSGSESSLQELMKLGPALHNRLGEGNSDNERRDEMMMLQAAQKWISLQEEKR